MPMTLRRALLHSEGAAVLVASLALYAQVGYGCVGMDRLAGYGLRDSSFSKETHLQRA